MGFFFQTCVYSLSSQMFLLLYLNISHLLTKSFNLPFAHFLQLCLSSRGADLTLCIDDDLSDTIPINKMTVHYCSYRRDVNIQKHALLHFSQRPLQSCLPFHARSCSMRHGTTFSSHSLPYSPSLTFRVLRPASLHVHRYSAADVL